MNRKEKVVGWMYEHLQEEVRSGLPKDEAFSVKTPLTSKDILKFKAVRREIDRGWEGKDENYVPNAIFNILNTLRGKYDKRKDDIYFKNVGAEGVTFGYYTVGEKGYHHYLLEGDQRAKAREIAEASEEEYHKSSKEGDKSSGSAAEAERPLRKEKEQSVQNDSWPHKLSEEDLHDFLVHYLRENAPFKEVYAKSTPWAKSKRKKGRKTEEGEDLWRYPDMIGVRPIDRKDKVRALEKELSPASRAGLFAFELKKEIKKGNLRKCYFQALANSGWANRAYLVASFVDGGALGEANRLNNAYGVGIIQLKPDGTGEILFDARHSEPDWSTIDFLASNEDFGEFVSLVESFLTTKKKKTISESRFFDELHSREELARKLNDLRNH